MNRRQPLGVRAAIEYIAANFYGDIFSGYEDEESFVGSGYIPTAVAADILDYCPDEFERKVWARCVELGRES